MLAFTLSFVFGLVSGFVFPAAYSVLTFVPVHCALIASSIHGHSVMPTFERTKSSSAFAPGALEKMARAPTRGMCSVEAKRKSVDVARGIRRVVLSDDEGLRVDRWTRVGRWA